MRKSIQVSTHESTIELTGKVHSLSEREGAERVAWAAPGVKSVVNHLQVTY